MATEGASEALQAGLALAGRAAREAPVPLTVSAAGWTAVLVAGRVPLPPLAAAALGWTGLALVLLMAPSKLGALHRLAARAEARDPPGPGGLQCTALEARLAATATALAGGGALLLAAVAALGTVAVLALRSLGRLEAGPLASLPLDVLLLAPAFVAASGWAVCVIGRFCVTLAADAAEPDARFARGWLLTRGAGMTAGAVWLLTCGLPSAALLATLGALDAFGTARGWAIPEAVAAGVALSAASQFLFAPLNAGALAQLRRAGLARQAGADAVDRAPALGDKAPPPRAAAAPPELIPT